ncbi:MAG TPA: nitrogen regulation protein NR(II) [Gammaproteobacteria bacterium]|nr:nitrogen regulation protein NR(II) [Gammaproteobacteria bacterium]
MSISPKTALLMFDNLSTAVLLFDKSLRLACVNAAGEDLLLISNRRAIGQTPSEIIPDPSTLEDTIKKALQTGRPYTERSVPISLSNGHSITVDCKVTPIIVDDDCSEIIVELIDADSIQRVLREESLSMLHDTARESLRGMAHEIKNPLGGIRGAAQLLQRELAENETDLVEYTKIIIQEADRLRDFIDRMLTSDQQKNIESINIHETLEYICSLVDAEYERSFAITRDYDPSLPMLEADRGQIIQAILNVLRNAVQAAGEDGSIVLRTRIIRQVTLHKQIHRLGVKIDIIDDGPGIPSEIEKSIFYPMITGRPEGTGLGLSIAQSLINAHGGSIEYERCNDKTVFSIYLPTEQEHKYEK